MRVLINITSTELQSPGQSEINKLRDNLIIVAATALRSTGRYEDTAGVCVKFTHSVTTQSVYTWQRIINILRLDSGSMLVTHFCSEDSSAPRVLASDGVVTPARVTSRRFVANQRPGFSRL